MRIGVFLQPDTYLGALRTATRWSQFGAIRVRLSNQLGVATLERRSKRQGISVADLVRCGIANSDQSPTWRSAFPAPARRGRPWSAWKSPVRVHRHSRLPASQFDEVGNREMVVAPFVSRLLESSLSNRVRSRGNAHAIDLEDDASRLNRVLV